MTKAYSVEGMSCSGCVKAVKNALEALPGVREAQVQLEEPQAIVSMDHAIPLQELQAGVSQAGSYRLAETKWGTAQSATPDKKQSLFSGLFHKKDCCK